MSYKTQIPTKVHDTIRSFKAALKRYYHSFQNKRRHKDLQSTGFYEEAKRAETQERNLVKALELYTKAIQNREKKDSSIKDFASSLHQLGYTKEAVRFMDDCQVYYEGNKEKYLRLRDNLEIQINPTGKHLCRYLLIENISSQIKNTKSQEQAKNLLFKSPKRIKNIIFLKHFDLTLSHNPCDRKLAENILVQFESFSAAKKTLESFYFNEWFCSNLYWVNYKTMTITCSAFDGKKDFEDNFIVTEQMIEEEIFFGKEDFWKSFGDQIYSSRTSNGFINLLATHLIKQYLIETEKRGQNKENIFESSKIPQKLPTEDSYSQNSLQDSNQRNKNIVFQKISGGQENKRKQTKYKNSWY